MRRKVLLSLGALMTIMLVAQPSMAQESETQKAEAEALPDITGTYILVSRELPDGTTQVPPTVAGMLTFTGKYRNFNVIWKDADGNTYSISYVAEYMLTSTEYTETPLMWVMTNEALPEKVSYVVPSEKGEVNPVTVKDGAVTMPIAGEPPVITFKGDDMTAVLEGEFVDHWKKVGGE